MKKLISYFTAALTALTMGVLSFGTVAQAQPLAVAHSAILQDITSAKQGLNQTVQYYPERRYYRDRSHNNRRYDRPRHWNGPRHGWNHNRPQYRPYYRSTQPRYYRSGRNSHVNWCHNRYRSYRSSDNTFQPNYGPRRQCYSPYI